MTDKVRARRALVTGATGFLGGHLTRALADLGADVHALSRLGANRFPTPGLEQVSWYEADLRDPDSLRRAIDRADPEVVYHLAAYGTTFEAQDPSHAFAVNVEGSLNLWHALGERSCRFVLAGSCAEYGDVAGRASERDLCQPARFYPATKNAAVTLVTALGRESGREVVVLRPYGPYGPGDRTNRIVPYVMRKLLAGETVDVTPGEQFRDYCYVEDHVSAFLLAGSRGLPRTGQIYNIGSGERITLRQLIEAVAETVGEETRSLVRFGAVPYRDGEIGEMCANIEAARRDLGWESKISLREGLKRTLDWHRAELGKPKRSQVTR